MRVDRLLDEARTNEAKMARQQAMELRFIDAASLENLCDVIVEDYRAAFGLAAVNLFLFDWDGTLSRFLADAEVAEREGVHVLEAGQAERLIELCQHQPWLGKYEDRLHHRHFPAKRHPLKSVALLPLTRRSRHIGLLALGSDDGSRFGPQLGTEFLQRMTAIVGVCIENSLNLERLRQLGLRDPLTHLYNRRYFLERILQAMNVAHRTGDSVACIYADIDHFKRINDRHGHPAGDAVLCEVARRISHELRVGEIVARLGGEEFAVMLTGSAAREAAQVAERIRQVIGDTDIMLGPRESISISLSSGVADWNSERMVPGARAVDDLISRADNALLSAKQKGRNCVVLDG